jgi:putative DNA primase/helicase
VIEADGKLHRFSTNGKKDDKSGRYILHIDNGIPSGYFQCYRQDIKRTWKAGRDLVPDLTREERQAMQVQAEQVKVRKQRAETKQQQAKADKSGAIWGARETRPAPFDFPYLVRKGIKPNGAKLYGAGLIIRMFDINGRLWNLQRIFSDGSQAFPVRRAQARAVNGAGGREAGRVGAGVGGGRLGNGLYRVRTGAGDTCYCSV